MVISFRVFIFTVRILHISSCLVYITCNFLFVTVLAEFMAWWWLHFALAWNVCLWRYWKYRKRGGAFHAQYLLGCFEPHAIFSQYLWITNLFRHVLVVGSNEISRTFNYTRVYAQNITFIIITVKLAQFWNGNEFSAYF